MEFLKITFHTPKAPAGKGCQLFFCYSIYGAKA
jgi:hypothetical protein